MPHQCVRCGRLYEDGSREILTGCACGSRFFFFMKKQQVEDVKQMTADLSVEEKEQIERDALDLVGEERPERPIVLDLESIRIVKPGKFELDLVDLFKGKPIVYKLDEGKYVIDIATVFKGAKADKEDEKGAGENAREGAGEEGEEFK